MGRPPTISDDEILAAARATLLELGVSATAAAVASRAGISEASIFYRFKTKEALFQRAIMPDAPPDWVRELPSRVGRGEIGAQLEEVAYGATRFFRVLIPLIMLNWSSAPHKHVQSGGPDPLPLISLKALARYFEAEMDQGRLKRHDSDVVARTFVGAIWNHVSMELIFDAGARMPLPESTFVRSLVRLLLEGMAGSPPLKVTGKSSTKTSRSG